MQTSLDPIIKVLEKAATQEPSKVAEAEAQLKDWETLPTFYQSLQTISFLQQLHLQIRCLAVIYLKNGIDKYWRKTCKNSISTEEKEVIKKQSLNVLHEVNDQLAIQHAVIIAKIARLDYPQEWPDLLHSLLSAIQKSSFDVASASDELVLVQKRALQTFYLIIKELCSRKLPRHRKALEEIAPPLFEHTLNIFSYHSNYVLSKSPGAIQSKKMSESEIQQMGISVSTSLFALKCIAKLIVHGFLCFYENTHALNMYQMAITFVDKYLQFRRSMLPETIFYKEITKHILIIGKMYVNLQQYHPIAFALCPGVINVLQYYWKLLVEHGSHLDKIEKEIPAKVLIQALKLLRKSIKNFSYTVQAASSDAAREEIIQAKSILDGLFSQPIFLKQLFEVVVSKYMMMTLEDQEQWENDPEGWFAEEESDYWEFKLRPCAEKLCMDMLSQHRELLGPYITEILSEFTASRIDHLPSILLKGAVYSAVSTSANDLYDYIDFDNWMESVLKEEVKNPNPNFLCIKYCVASLIGGWVGVKISKQYRIHVYQILGTLLQPNEHIIVKLKAATSLKYCIDDWDFELDTFLPYMNSFIDFLVHLIQVSEDHESKIRVLNCLSILVQRSESHAIPYAPKICQLLPELWNNSSSQNLFKNSIIALSVQLVKVLKDHSNNLYPFILPIINYSVDVSHPEYVFLYEDALELWEVTMENAVHCTEELSQLFPHCIKLLQMGSDSLRVVFSIIQAYMLFMPQQIIMNYGVTLMESIGSLIGDGNQEVDLCVINTIDCILVCVLHFGGGNTLLSSGLLYRLFKCVIEEEIARPSYIIAGYMTLFSRVVIASTEIFNQFLNAVIEQEQKPDLRQVLITKWIDKFDFLSGAKQRKLTAMAFSALIGTAEPAVIQHIHEVIILITSVLSDLKELDTNDSMLTWNNDNHEDTPQNNRRLKMMSQDPAHSIDIQEYVKDNFSKLHLVEPPEHFYSRLDPTLLQKFNELMSPPIIERT